MTAAEREIYGRLPWWINVSKYFQVGESFTGHRWRMSYDDTFIADFDHEPTMNECMEALIRWWT
jgi:hypothetical protein